MKSSEKTGKNGKSAFVQSSVRNVYQVGPNWVVILGGAIVSVLSVKLGYKLKYKLKQVIETNQKGDDVMKLNESERKSARQGTFGVHPLHSNLCCCRLDGEVCNHHVLGACDGTVEMKLGPCQCENENTHPLSLQQCKLSEIPILSDSGQSIPLWESQEQLDLANGHLQQSNSPESVCTSDTGSDLFTKRDVIHRLRLQVKRRDDMILEMQAQIIYQQQTITNQLSQVANLQSQLDAANMDLFGAEREIQRLRKAIADHCLGHVGNNSCSPGRVTTKHRLLEPSLNISFEDVYGPTTGDAERGGTQRFEEQKPQGESYGLKTPDIKLWKIREDLQCFSSDTKEDMTTNGHTIEGVNDVGRELGELKQLVSAKNNLLEAHERQRVELCYQLKELQLKLDTQVASVL